MLPKVKGSKDGILNKKLMTFKDGFAKEGPCVMLPKIKESNIGI